MQDAAWKPGKGHASSSVLRSRDGSHQKAAGLVCAGGHFQMGGGETERQLASAPPADPRSTAMDVEELARLMALPATLLARRRRRPAAARRAM